jgi:hypothetical protein
MGIEDECTPGYLLCGPIDEQKCKSYDPYVCGVLDDPCPGTTYKGTLRSLVLLSYDLNHDDHELTAVNLVWIQKGWNILLRRLGLKIASTPIGTAKIVLHIYPRFTIMAFGLSMENIPGLPSSHTLSCDSNPILGKLLTVVDCWNRLILQEDIVVEDPTYVCPGALGSDDDNSSTLKASRLTGIASAPLFAEFCLTLPKNRKDGVI